MKIILKNMLVLMRKYLAEKQIKICTGAGCSAWSSDVVVEKLENARGFFGRESYEICLTKCMNRCGGGVSLGFPSCNDVIKLKDPEKVFDFVAQEHMELNGIRKF